MSFYNVLEVLKDPSLCDYLHIYIITNFNPNRQALISNQVVNHLKIFPIALVRGVVIRDETSTQVKLYDKLTEEYSIVLNDAIRFETNDDIDVILKNKNFGYCFTVNERWQKTRPVPLYYLAKCDKAIDGNIRDDVTAPEDDQPVQKQKYFSLFLQNIEKIVTTPQTQIDISLAHFLPSIQSINWISYEIPVNSVYQTLTVYGTLRNSKTGKILSDIPIPLKQRVNDITIAKESSSWSASFLPILCNITSLTAPARLNIKNFDLRYQLPFDLIKDVWKSGRPFDICAQISLFSGGDELDDEAKSLIKLFKKMFVYSYVYRLNFVLWKKKQQDSTFISYFNAVFANKTVLEFNKSVLENWKLNNPWIEQRIGDNNRNKLIWEKFMALCLACSSFLASPFSWNEANSNEHRNFLWYYFELATIKGEDLDSVISSCFNDELGIIEENLNNLRINCTINSNFFKWVKYKDNYRLISKIKSISHAEINISELEKLTVPQLPDTLTSVNNNWDPYAAEPVDDKLKYLCNLFIYDKDLESFLSLWTIRHSENVLASFEFEKSITKNGDTRYSSTPSAPAFNVDDLKATLPLNQIQELKIKDKNGSYSLDFDNGELLASIDVKVSAPIITCDYMDCSDQYDQPAEKKWYDPSEWAGAKPARHGENIADDLNHCRVWYDDRSYARKISDKVFGILGEIATYGMVDTYKRFNNFPTKMNYAIMDRKILRTHYYWRYSFDTKLTIKSDCINNFAQLDSFGLYRLMNRNASVWKESVTVTFELDDELKKLGWDIILISHDKHVGFFNSATKTTMNCTYLTTDDDGQTVNQKVLTESWELDFNFQKNNPAQVKTEHRY